MGHSGQHYERARALFVRDERLDEALIEIKRAVKLTPSYEALTLMGVILDGLGTHRTALGCYSKAIRIRPRDPEAYWKKADTLVWKAFAEAELLAKKALSLAMIRRRNQELAFVYHTLAWILMEQGKTEAVTVLREGIKRTDSNILRAIWNWPKVMRLRRELAESKGSRPASRRRRQ